VTNVTSSLETGSARVWRCTDLGGLELFRASSIQFTFRPHAHEQFFIALTEAGGPRPFTAEARTRSGLAT
jgi:hypothetical protein